MREWFENLKFFQQIELGLLIIFFYGSILYWYQEVPKEQHSFRPKISGVQITHNELVSFVYQALEKYQIETFTLHSKEKGYVILEVQSEYNSNINLVALLQKYLAILFFSIEPYESQTILKLHLKRDGLLMAKPKIENIVQKNFQSPFDTPFKRTQQKPLSQSLPPITIDAIIGDEILVQGDWYQKNQMVNGYKVVSIDHNRVTFLHKETQKILTQKVDFEK